MLQKLLQLKLLSPTAGTHNIKQVHIISTSYNNDNKAKHT